MSSSLAFDWATREHAVCAVDERGKSWISSPSSTPLPGWTALSLVSPSSRRRPSFASPSNARPACSSTPSSSRLRGRADPSQCAQGQPPPLLRRAGKTDPGDAFILADLLRTDGHRFRPRRPPSDDTRALRALVRGRDDLVAHRLALANQLRALLERFWPGAAAIFADVASPIALAFLTRYPTPHRAARLGEKRLAQFLGQHAYCGRRPVAELLARLRTAPASHVGEAEAEASSEVVRALVAVLTPLGTHLQLLSAAITAALPQHPDGPLVQSLPRSGAVNAAQILAELGDDRARFPSAEHLAAEGGLAPVTHASGKHHAVVFRWACNKRLRRALTTFADNSRHASPWAARVYQRARARGCRHPHAIRILARAWARIWRCWQDRAAYDPANHRNAQRLTPSASSTRRPPDAQRLTQDVSQQRRHRRQQGLRG